MRDDLALQLLLRMAVVAALTLGFTAAQARGVGPSAAPNPNRLEGYTTFRGRHVVMCGSVCREVWSAIALLAAQISDHCGVFDTGCGD